MHLVSCIFLGLLLTLCMETWHYMAIIVCHMNSVRKSLQWLFSYSNYIYLLGYCSKLWRKNYLYWVSPQGKKAVNWKWLKYYWRIFLTNYTFFKTIQVLKSPRRCLTSYLKNSLTVNFSSFIFGHFVWIPYLTFTLTILTGNNFCFTQFSTVMAGWLLLIFFICLHSQLSSTHSIISTDVWKMWFIK